VAPHDDEFLQASIGDILDVAREVSAIAADFNERLQATNTQVGNFLDGGWTGPSGSAYSDAFREWSEGTGEVQSGLEQMGGALSDNAIAYGNRDKASEESLSAFDLPDPAQHPPLPPEMSL